MAARYAKQSFWISVGTASEFVMAGSLRDSVTGASAVAQPGLFGTVPLVAGDASGISALLAGYLAVYPNGPQL